MLNNAQATGEGTNEGTIPRFVRPPLSRSASVSSQDDSLSVVTAELDDYTKSLFSGTWIHDDRNHDDDDLPLVHLADRSSYDDVMKLIDDTLQEVGQMSLQLDNDRPRVMPRTVELGHVDPEEDMDHESVDLEHGEQAPLRIPRPRRRIYNAKRNRLERLVDRIRAALIFGGYLAGSAKFYSESLSHKVFGLKVLGVTAFCYLSTIPLEDPRGDKANMVTIVYSRKTALLIIYIWVWVSAMGWTAGLLSQTEELPVNLAVFAETPGFTIESEVFPNETEAHDFPNNEAALDFHAFISVMTKEPEHEPLPVLDVNESPSPNSVPLTVQPPNSLRGSTLRLNRGQQKKTEHLTVSKMGTNSEFTFRGSLTRRADFETIKIPSKPAFGGRSLLRGRPQERSRDEIVESDESESILGAKVDCHTDDPFARFEPAKLANLAAFCVHLLRFLESMRGSLCSVHSQSGHLLQSSASNSVAKKNRLSRWIEEASAVDMLRQPYFLHSSALMFGPAARMMSAASQAWHHVLTHLADGTGESPGLETNQQAYYLKLSALVNGPVARLARSTWRKQLSQRSFLLGTGGSKEDGEMLDKLAEHWYSPQWK